MSRLDIAALERAVADLPKRYPGPGGAVAVVKDGATVLAHGWGYANLETRAPYTTATLAPICSITKQFTCATMLSVAPDPSVLDGAAAAQLPRLQGEKPSTRDLANNQSGLRDYWALTVLVGAMPEGDFRPADSARLLALTRSLHFRPGTHYSYSNGNFRILANAVAETTGADFGTLLTERVSGPAGMETASFVAETSAFPGGASGYEGTLATGWRPGINRLYWSGDAGLCASIDDLAAWERFIDQTRDDPDGLYNRLSQPVTFRDGSAAPYGLGLVRENRWGRAMTGHGGAIRGWRLQRFHVASERLSVAIAFNHESDSHGAAVHLLAAALGESDAPAPSNAALAAGFAGSWLDGDTGLLLDVAVAADGTLAASYAGHPEILSIGDDGVARGEDMRLERVAGGLAVARTRDGIRATASRPGVSGSADVAGRYRSEELEAEMEIVDAGGSLFAGFRGFLGVGPMMPLEPAGDDLWRLVCMRSLDAPAPGDWTVRIARGGDGRIIGLEIGCWLARRVPFVRA